MAHLFLSEDWIEEARRIRAEFHGKVEPLDQAVRMNLVVTEVPFEPGQLDAYLDTTEGEIDLEVGHLEGPDLVVVVDYETAKAILVDGNSQVGMQAFMMGKVQVQGDIAKLLALQAGPPDPAAQELAGRLREITQ